MDFYKKSYRIVILQALFDNYIQYLYDNYKRRRQPLIDNHLRPPNFYYDYENNRQSQNVLNGLQINSKFILLNHN